MKNGYPLLASVSAVALTFGMTSAAVADPDIIQQGIINTGPIGIDPGTAIQEVGNLDVQSSVTIGASGASASVSNLAIGDEFVSIGDETDDTVDPVIGDITQGGTAANAVSNEGAVTTTDAAIEFQDNSTVGQAASAGISALGAASSISFAALNDNENGTGYTAPDVNGQISQQAENDANVTNTENDISAAGGGTGNAPDLAGDAASLSMNATGAATSLGLRSVDTDGFTADTIGLNQTDGTDNDPGITQSASNTTDGTIRLDEGTIEGGTLSGVGASVSAGASGAVASVNTTSNASVDFEATLPAIDQTASNAGNIVADDMTLATGPVTGTAASVGLSATAASANVSETFISQDDNTQSNIGDVSASTNGDFDGDGITQQATATSTANVDVVDSSVTTGAIGSDAAGASVRASAVGASVSVGSAMLEGGGTEGLTGADFGTIDQTAESTADVTVGDSADTSNNVSVETLAGVLGAASSVGVSALGAGASVNSSVVGDGSGTAVNNTGATFDEITQSVTSNADGTVLNTDSQVTIGETGDTSLGGVASSANIGATGASAGVGGAVIASSSVTGSAFDDVTNTVTNEGSVTTRDATLDVSAGDVSGLAASGSIGAAGATASVSSSVIDSSESSGATFGDVTSNVTNEGVVSTDDATLTATGSDVSGIGASLSISALGASAGASTAVVGGVDNTHGTFGVVDQTVTNEQTVEVNDPFLNLGVGDGNLAGIAASASIGATGAAASAGSSTISSTNTEGATFASIDQTVEGETTGSRGVRVTGTANTDDLVVGEIGGFGASASVAATGATANVSSTWISSTVGTAGSDQSANAFTGTIDQKVSLDDDFSVTVQDVGVDTSIVDGTAASVGVSALGASASVSSTAISASGGADEFETADFQGAIDQDVTNNADVQNRRTSLNTGALAGDAASARIGATGASASVGSTVIDGSNVDAGSFDNIDQEVANTGQIDTFGTEDATDLDVGALSGTAASAGVSATGATAGVSATLIDTSVADNAGATFGDVSQDVSNSDTVTLGDTSTSSDRDVTIEIAGGGVALSGTAASVNASALGASASVGQSAIDASGELASFGTIDQDVSNTAEVANRNTSIEAGGLSGVASSASIGATGAAASVSTSLIEASDDVTGATFGNITQGTDATERDVSNTQNVLVSGASIDGGVDTTDPADPVTDPIVLDGTAASVGISATGATAGVSLAALGEAGGTLGEVTVGDIGQFVANTGGASVSVNDSTLTVDLSAGSGIADSASISARGAGASVGVTQVDTENALGGASGEFITMGAITQDVINQGNVTIGGDVSIVSADGINGIGTSASIAAVGAGASFGLTSIESATAGTGMTNVEVASINQTVNNSAGVSNGGSITVGGAMGPATSASVSATGATASVSTTSINGGM